MRLTHPIVLVAATLAFTPNASAQEADRIPDFAIELKKLAVTVGFDGRREHMKRKFSLACDELVAIGWLSHYEIKGSGRSKPQVLHVSRSRKLTKS